MIVSRRFYFEFEGFIPAFFFRWTVCGQARVWFRQGAPADGRGRRALLDTLCQGDPAPVDGRGRRALQTDGSVWLAHALAVDRR